MNVGLVGAVALAGAVAVGGLGYALGTANGPAELSTANLVADAPLNEVQRSEVESLIRSHLIANPEIFNEVVAALQLREAEEQRVAQAGALTENAELLFAADGDAVLGNPDGDVTLVEFFDYNCGYCRRSVEDLQNLIENDPELRVVLKEFPVLGPASIEAARVSVAVNEIAPDKFSDFHFALLSENGQVDGERAIAVAEEYGIDGDAVRQHVESEGANDVINAVYEVADNLNLTGTPTFVTRDEVVVGAVGEDQLRTKIASLRP